MEAAIYSDLAVAPVPKLHRERKMAPLARYLLFSSLLHAIPFLALPYAAGIFTPQEPEVVSFSVKMQQESRQVTVVAPVPGQKAVAHAQEAGLAAANLDGEIEVKKVTYEMMLASRIEKYRYYPKMAQKLGKQGTPVVRLVVDANGKLLDARIERSSGEEILDMAALDIIARAQPFPRPPDDYLELISRRGDTAFVFHAPIGFDLKSVN